MGQSHFAGPSRRGRLTPFRGILRWPETIVAGFGVVQVVALAWIAGRQQQVKRDLNGSTDQITVELYALEAKLDELLSTVRTAQARQSALHHPQP